MEEPHMKELSRSRDNESLALLVGKFGQDYAKFIQYGYALASATATGNKSS